MDNAFLYAFLTTKAVAFSKSNYNSKLTKLIDEELKKHRYSVDKLDKLIRESARTQKIPTSTKLHENAMRLDGLRIESQWFKVLIDLLANAGNFRHASQRTYFPP